MHEAKNRFTSSNEWPNFGKAYNWSRSAAALSSPSRRSRFFLFSPPKHSRGIGCRPFLGSQPGRVLYLSRAWDLVALAHFRARALRVGFFAMAPNGLQLAAAPFVRGLFSASGGVAARCCYGSAASSHLSRPLLQGSGLLSVDKRDQEPGPAVWIGASPVRRSGHHCDSEERCDVDVDSGKRTYLGRQEK